MNREEIGVCMPLVYDLIGGSNVITRQMAVALIKWMYEQLDNEAIFTPPSNVIDMQEYRQNKWYEISDDEE